MSNISVFSVSIGKIDGGDIIVISTTDGDKTILNGFTPANARNVALQLNQLADILDPPAKQE